MPSPFLRIGQPNMSRGDRDPERPPEPEELIPEEYAGDNNPYRGIQNHGVAQVHEPVDVPGHNGRPVEFAVVELREEDAVPVRIVQGVTSRELSEWRVIRENATTTARRILGLDDRKRSNVKIKNLHASDTVYLCHESMPSTAFGYPVEFGEEFTLIAQQTEVWALSATANDIPLAISYEYSVTV